MLTYNICIAYFICKSIDSGESHCLASCMQLSIGSRGYVWVCECGEWNARTNKIIRRLYMAHGSCLEVVGPNYVVADRNPLDMRLLFCLPPDDHEWAHSFPRWTGRWCCARNIVVHRVLSRFETLYYTSKSPNPYPYSTIYFFTHITVIILFGAGHCLRQQWLQRPMTWQLGNQCTYV